MGGGDAQLLAREEEAKGRGGGPLRRAGKEEPARHRDTSYSLSAPGLQLPACLAAARTTSASSCAPRDRACLNHRQ